MPSKPHVPKPWRHRRAKKRFTRQQRAQRINNRLYGAFKEQRGLTLKSLARSEHLSTGRVRYYLRLLANLKTASIESRKVKHGKKIWIYWFYYDPKQRLKEREDNIKLIGEEKLKDEHDAILKSGGSKLIDDVEEYYRSDHRSTVAQKIRRISSMSLGQVEKNHILRHLGLI